MDSNIHICSLVVHHQPNYRETVVAGIDKLTHASIPYRDEHSKLVVVLESNSEKQMNEHMSRIAAIKGVISSNLVYQQHEPIETIDEEITV